MSDERINIPIGTNNSHVLGEEDEYRLEDVIERLNVQINVFEQKLESAIHTETQFRKNAQGLLNSLDAFVARHVEKDRHLTQLIEEDTQRSKNAKEEYDALASRFGDNLRKHNFARTKAWLGTVSVYVGIVISVVLMAPIQAVWWLLSRSLTRMGLIRSSEGTTLYSDVRRRRRYVSGKAASSTHSGGIARHRRRPSQASSVAIKERDTTNALSSALSKRKITKDEATAPDATRVKLGSRVRNETQQHHSDPSTLEKASHEGDKDLTTDKRETGSNSVNVEAVVQTDQGESSDEFFDARNGSERHSPHSSEVQAVETEEIELEDGEEEGDIENTEDAGDVGDDEDDGDDGDGEEEAGDTTAGENSPDRPGWALPSGSDEGLPDLSNFPSSEFWDISDEDIRLGARRSDRSTS